MFHKARLHIGGIAIIACLFCDFASAQLYNAPNINSVETQFATPSINRRLGSIRAIQASAGYGGMRSPALATPQPMSSSGYGRIGLGVGGSSGSKPFSSYQAAPTVSPYLNLFRDDFSGTKDFNYSTLVQPQLQQQQLNQQQQRQNIQTNRRLQSIAAQADFNQQGSKDSAPTGHQTVFQYTGRYYSLPLTRQKRR